MRRLKYLSQQRVQSLTSKACGISNTMLRISLDCPRVSRFSGLTSGTGKPHVKDVKQTVATLVAYRSLSFFHLEVVP